MLWASHLRIKNKNNEEYILRQAPARDAADSVYLGIRRTL